MSKKQWYQKKRQQTASKNTGAKERGIRHGYRSGLEDKIAKQITNAGIDLQYETDKVQYIVPERSAKYTPDFKLPKQGGFFYVETKGIWNVADRQKHLLIKKQHPDLDIRFVFSNCNSKLYKGSKTTYAAYCDKHGFVYAHKTIPEEWLHEGN
jgi:predicted nuclease of restriction endonuclease-like RecB superfamily